MYIVYMHTMGADALNPPIGPLSGLPVHPALDGGKWESIHDSERKLLAGTIVQGINTIDSFTFTVPPSNYAFNNIRDLITLVKVQNTRTGKCEFFGRVLYSTPSMDEKGRIAREVICESVLGLLCDSQQFQKNEEVVTLSNFLTSLMGTHKSQVEDYKRVYSFIIEDEDLKKREVTRKGDRKGTWDTLKETVLDPGIADVVPSVEGSPSNGHLTLRFYPAGKSGEDCDTEIRLGKNMKSITREIDPTAYVTRLIPLGTAEGSSSDSVVNIREVNEGLDWIDATEAEKEAYGIRVGYHIFEGVTDPATLKAKGEQWLKDQRLKVKNSITTLDLSLLGLDPSAFEIRNTYPIKHTLLGIDDRARVTKKTINICDETKATLEFGESTKRLSEVQREQTTELSKISARVSYIIRDYAKNEQLKADVEAVRSSIMQDVDDIYLGVEAFNEYKTQAAAELNLKVGKDENDRVVSMLNASANRVNLSSNRLVIMSDHFTLAADGTVWANAIVLDGGITGKTESEGAITNGYEFNGGRMLMRKAENENNGYAEYDMEVLNRGSLGYALLRFNTTSENGIHLFPIGGLLSGTWSSTAAISTTSDRNAKHAIEALPEKYRAVFDRLRPVRFKYNDGTSDRYHTGFIAQEVEEAILSAGLSTQDAAMLVKDEKPDGASTYGLRYEEMVALLVDQVQRLNARVAELEAKEAKA